MDFEHLRIKDIRTVIRYRSEVQSRSVRGRHSHIIGVNLTGFTRHDLGYKHMDIPADTLYFFNQRDDYDLVTEEAGYCYSIHFTTFEPIETDSFCKKTTHTEEIVQLIRRVETGWLSEPRASLQTLSDFYAVCALIHRLYTAPYAPRDERVFAARGYLDLHFREKDCLARAAALCPVSRRRFNDLFRLHFQTTPGAYVTARRIAYARELLETGYLSVAGVAEMAGFSDVYYFSRLFHREAGVTPGACKKPRADRLAR